MTQDDKAVKIYNEFLNGTTFIDSLKLRTQIERCINFEEGRQWNMDEDVEDFPKITLNVIKQIGKVRKSGIMQNEYGYLVNTNMFKDIRKMQDFLKYLSNKLKLKKLDLKIVNDVYKKGTGILFFYWDAEKRSFLGKSGGTLRAEVIDIRRFRVADPYIQELQDQEYVMYVTEETVQSIKDKYDIEVTPDGEQFASATEKVQATEDVSEEKVNVYTKFYRNEDGQVHFIISTKEFILKDATPLNPYYDGSKKETSNTMSVMDEKTKSKLENEVFNLYPFASLVLDERDNCFYGIPGAYELIESQKSINHHFSIYDKGLQDNVLGGFMMKQGILGDQELTTENGQVLEFDLLPGESLGNVFGRIPVNNIPSDTLNYSGNLLGTIKSVSGATNIAIGQSDYAGQSGKQTEMLLQRARENSSDMAMLFNEFKSDQAYIMFLFAKFFYDNEAFSIVEHGMETDQVRSYVGENKFDGNKYLGEEVLINIKVGPAPSFSEYSSMELLGMMVQSGQAPLEVYLANLPDGYVNNRQELLQLAQNNSQKVIEQLQQQIAQSNQVMQQMSQAYQQTQKDMKNIDTVLNENERLKSMLAELAAKGIEIQQRANETNNELTSDMANLLNIMKRSKNDKTI